MRFPFPPRRRGLAAAAVTVGLLLTVAGCVGTAATPDESGTSSATATSSLRAGGCTTDQLAVTVDSSKSGQQTIEPVLVLTNRSTRACTLQGTPEVAFTSAAEGHRIGPAALEEPSQPEPEVTLQPGTTAEVDLIVDFPDKTSTPCQQEDAAGFAVTLPGTRQPIFVAYPYPACGNKRLLAVFPLGPR